MTKLVPPAKSGEKSQWKYNHLQKHAHTSELVELERESYGEEEQLVGDCDQERDGQIIVVQSVYFYHVAE